MRVLWPDSVKCVVTFLSGYTVGWHDMQMVTVTSDTAEQGGLRKVAGDTWRTTARTQFESDARV